MSSRSDATPTLTNFEWQVLWEFHQAAEKAAVEVRDYQAAALHKDRHEQIARFVSPADAWERSWSNQA